MTPQKQFTGFLSSVANPGELSLTISSLTKALIWGASAYAVINGVDSQPIVSGIQQIMDLTLTGVTAGFTAFHAAETAYGLVRKLWYLLAAKPVLSVPTAMPVAVPVDPSSSV